MSLKVFSSTKKLYLDLVNTFFPILKNLERVLKIADHYITAVIPDFFSSLPLSLKVLCMILYQRFPFA